MKKQKRHTSDQKSTDSRNAFQKNYNMPTHKKRQKLSRQYLKLLEAQRAIRVDQTSFLAEKNFRKLQ